MQYVNTCKHDLSQHFYELYFMYFIYFSMYFLLTSSYGKFLLSFVYVIIYCVGAEITILMSITDGSDPYFFRQKMEITWSVKQEVDGEMFISHQRRHLFLYK